MRKRFTFVPTLPEDVILIVRPKEMKKQKKKDKVVIREIENLIKNSKKI